MRRRQSRHQPPAGGFFTPAHRSTASDVGKDADQLAHTRHACVRSSGDIGPVNPPDDSLTGSLQARAGHGGIRRSFFAYGRTLPSRRKKAARRRLSYSTNRARWGRERELLRSGRSGGNGSGSGAHGGRRSGVAGSRSGGGGGGSRGVSGRSGNGSRGSSRRRSVSSRSGLLSGLAAGGQGSDDDQRGQERLVHEIPRRKILGSNQYR